MNWIKFKSKDKKEELLLNNNEKTYYLYFSPRTYIPINNEEEYDIECIQYYYKGIPSTYDIKNILINLIKEYDNSNEVNKFRFGEQYAWFDKSTRLGLINSLNIEKELNRTKSIIWINGKSYSINIDKMLIFLKQLEEYSIRVFQTTQQHIANTINITNRHDLFNYNITNNYPEPIELVLE